LLEPKREDCFHSDQCLVEFAIAEKKTTVSILLSWF